MKATHQVLLEALRDAVGERHVLTDPASTAPYFADWRGAYHGSALAVVRPARSGEVAAVVRACTNAGVGIVPQGGNTGMCGGAVPDENVASVVIALGRMNRIVNVDALDNTITVEAGCVLQAVQEAAADADRLFPLSLAAEGSCQIGGVIGTNAGGINVLRYGNTRDLVLGLEAVLPDGTLWSGLRALRKDNRGYDLKQLFIGAEGTLGIVTAAVLKLFPRPRQRLTTMLAVASPAVAVEFLSALRGQLADRVSAYELIGRRCLDLVFSHSHALRDPFAAVEPWYVLLDIEDDDSSTSRMLLEPLIAEWFGDTRIRDALVAETLAQSRALWQLRESIPEAIRNAGDAFRSDISIPVSRLPSFLDAAALVLSTDGIESRGVCFGHVGDGNLHFNVLAPDDVPFKKWSEGIAIRLYDIVAKFDGSFSAEHGIGQAKRAELARYKDPIEVGLMRTIKQALDPAGRMNPGKVL